MWAVLVCEIVSETAEIVSETAETASETASQVLISSEVEEEHLSPSQQEPVCSSQRGVFLSAF